MVNSKPIDVFLLFEGVLSDGDGNFWCGNNRMVYILVATSQRWKVLLLRIVFNLFHIFEGSAFMATLLRSTVHSTSLTAN